MRARHHCERQLPTPHTCIPSARIAPRKGSAGGQPQAHREVCSVLLLHASGAGGGARRWSPARRPSAWQAIAKGAAPGALRTRAAGTRKSRATTQTRQATAPARMGARG